MSARWLQVASLFAGVAACSPDVPIGSWAKGIGASGNAGTTGGSGTGGGGAGGDAGSKSSTGGTESAGAGPQAGAGGEAGGLETARVCGNEVDNGLESAKADILTEVAVPQTTWTWPSALDSIEWDLGVESDFISDGYFWSHQFGFVGSDAHGFMGIQARGGYQADPPSGKVDITNMVVFWISSAQSEQGVEVLPLAAELGDYAYPDARTYVDTGRYTTGDEKTTRQWLTIHNRHDWESCHGYRLRMGVHSVADTGDIWYGGWMTDTETGVETYLGKILVPASWGQLAPETQMWSNRIGHAPLLSCNAPEAATALFGIPTGNAGKVRPTSHVNGFGALACSLSSVTDYANGVRQKAGWNRR